MHTHTITAVAVSRPDLDQTEISKCGWSTKQRWGIIYRHISPVVRELETILIALSQDDQQTIKKLAERLASANSKAG